MNAQNRSSSLLHRTQQILLVSALAVVATGCDKPVTDAQLQTNVQSAISGDSRTANEPVSVAVQNGIVSLTGNVTDDTVRAEAAQDAATVKGVKEVMNDITVAGVQVAPTVTTPQAPKNPRPTTVAERTAIEQHQPLPPPVDTAAPIAPVEHDITLPAGSVIPVRIDEGLSSATSQDGQPFHGTVTHEVIADGMVIIPAGSSVSGRVIDAKDATHFKGSSALSIEITGIRRHGVQLPVATDAYTVYGKGRGTNTAEKIGGGAAVGAILGGIFGGGKGAAIGAAAGGGGGAAWQAATKGQQVSIAPESIIHFHTAQAITVRTSESASDYAPVTLQHR